MSDHLDNDLDNILAKLAWNGKYTDSGQEVVNAGEVIKAKEAIDQYTQSKLKAFAGEYEQALPSKKKGHAECTNPEHGKVMSVAEVEDRNFNTGHCTCGWEVNFVMPLVDEGYNRAITELEEAIKAIKEKYQL
jgi:hypothetical protein